MDVNAGRRRDVKTRSGKNNTRYSVLTAVLVPLHTYNKHASCAHAHDIKRKKKDNPEHTEGARERKKKSRKRRRKGRNKKITKRKDEEEIAEMRGGFRRGVSSRVYFDFL